LAEQWDAGVGAWRQEGQRFDGDRRGRIQEGAGSVDKGEGIWIVRVGERARQVRDLYPEGEGSWRRSFGRHHQVCAPGGCRECPVVVRDKPGRTRGEQREGRQAGY